MQTQLSPEYHDTPEGREAESILRKCVHCGFCTATCPTYQLLGDELDGRVVASISSSRCSRVPSPRARRSNTWTGV